jgi:hypothetical protein
MQGVGWDMVELGCGNALPVLLVHGFLVGLQGLCFLWLQVVS